MDWLIATISDDKSGTSTESINGSLWASELGGAVAIIALAWLISFVLRRPAMIISALAAIIASWWPLSILAGEPAMSRIQNLLDSRISSWAVVSDYQTSYTGPIIALIGCAIVLFGSIIAAIKKDEAKIKKSTYKNVSARKEKIEDDLKENPDSGRVLWDALDNGIDPTTREKE